MHSKVGENNTTSDKAPFNILYTQKKTYNNSPQQKDNKRYITNHFVRLIINKVEMH